jgi:hypothetical protein
LLIRTPRTTFFAAVALGAMLAVAGSASAATRFAEPNGNGPSGLGGCPETNPCSLEAAIEDPAIVNGDEVIVLPGTYETQTDTVRIDNSIMVRSRDADPRPVIPTTDGFGILMASGGATVRRLQIESSADGGAPLWMTSGGTAERMVVIRTNAATGSGNVVELGASVLRDSVLWNAGTGDAAHFGVNGNVTRTATVRNVTAVATGGAARAIFVEAFNGAELTIDAKNVIASGGAADVAAATNSASDTTATASLANSNYDTESESGTGAAVTNPGSPSNQTTAPVFVNAAAGDFHQTSLSPTINQGDGAASQLGTLDIDDETRTFDAAPDIGSDEFVDTDTDTVADIFDNCPNASNTDQSDGDGDSVGDVCDNCPAVANAAQEDADGDDIGDLCDPDLDGDGASNTSDNCPNDANPSQQDSDADGTGDACDPTPLPPEPQPGDTEPPNTSITDGPKDKTKKKQATFEFTSSEPGSTFECAVDGQTLKVPCTSPYTVKVKKGKHTFQVRATDQAGNADGSPASDTWKVRKKSK